MLNPWFWLEPFFATPKGAMAEAEAAKQKHAEEKVNPKPDWPLPQPPSLAQTLIDWRADNALEGEIHDIELDDLFERLQAHINRSKDTESQAIIADREKSGVWPAHEREY